MNEHEYNQACAVFFKILETQTNLLNNIKPHETNGKVIAQTAWGFIEEFQNQYLQKVHPKR